MKRLKFNATVNAPAPKVYDTMLGLSNKATYEKWTAAFNPTSTFKGKWSKGEKMYFLGSDDKGETGGMISEIADIVPNRYVSIRHYGLLHGDKEITEGPEVEKWAGGMENYHFEESDGKTTVTIEVDTDDVHVDYMEKAFPKALSTLKGLCESK
ncbi:MAG: SRPBCC domain-containing protein [Saprospirales bacterium]|nr:MAG: SRPBCC domain-containing protein [Saprospirales bacterium]